MRDLSKNHPMTAPHARSDTDLDHRVVHHAIGLNSAVSPPGGSEPFTDEEEVREKVADSIANLIEVRSRIQAGTYRSPLELARLDNELASAIELLRLITRDVRHQDETQGSMGPA